MTATRSQTKGARFSDQRRDRERRGRIAERVVEIWLILSGHRILARRAQTPFGEIDLIAKRGRRVAFVEVKWRSQAEDIGQLVSRRQARRIADAAEYWLWRQPRLRTCAIGLDCVLLSPQRLPSYARDALQPT